MALGTSGSIVINVNVGQREIGRDVDETRLGIKGHGMPVVSPCGTRHNHHIVQFDRLLSDHRPTILVDLASGPILLGERCRRQKLSILRIKHVKEAVFRRLHDHSAARAIFSKRKICKHHLLRGRKVPLITGCCLVMPPISPSVRVEREYGGQE